MLHDKDFFEDMEEMSEVLGSLSIPSERAVLGTTPAMRPHQHLQFFSVIFSSHLIKATVEIEPNVVAHIFRQTVELFREGNFEGFQPHQPPAEYVEEVYKTQILNTVKNYIFHHLIIDFLMSELVARKIPASNYPRLTSIEIMADKKIIYHFDVSIADQLELKEWRHFAFKQPKRKKYKDLDKQVVAFVENRGPSSRKNTSATIEESDWVCFDANLGNVDKNALAPQLISSFWLRVGKQDVVEPFICQLIGKELDQSFYTNNLNINHQNPKCDDRSYNLLISIKAIVKGSCFSLDMFKTMFKLKNKAEIHNKLMEVFSYRNDVSQRKAIIEEVFHLLLSKHRFEVPKHLVLRREEDIIDTLAKQPDYHVYKAQKDFGDYVELLAEKQLKEEIIIDQIAYHENIKVEMRDVGHYLHLLSNRRLKEFIYFKPVLEKVDDLSAPINTAILAQAVMREKTLNFIIYTLTR